MQYPNKRKQNVGSYSEPNIERTRERTVTAMLFCTDCGRVIEEEDELAEYMERGEFWGSEYTEVSKVCPKCKGSATIVLTKKCDSCGEYITGAYVTTMDGRFYCENCYTEGDVNYEYDS